MNKGPKTETKDIVEMVKAELVRLTGFTSPHVIGLNKEADIWHITVEIIEKPSEAANLDLLGIYDIQADLTGSLLGYERVRMRKRGAIE